MFRNALTKINCVATSLLRQQIRTTYVLKRKYPVRTAVEDEPKSIRNKNRIYELVEHRYKDGVPDLRVILTSFVEGLGVRGDIIEDNGELVRNHLLAPGLAVYASPDNLQKFAKEREEAKRKAGEQIHSSAFAPKTVRILAKLVVPIAMNKLISWTLQPQHVKTGFRSKGIVVSTDGITIPREIKGPNASIINKEFYIFISINSTERVPVRCRIHYIGDRLDLSEPTEPLFEEDRQFLDDMPKPGADNEKESLWTKAKKIEVD